MLHPDSLFSRYKEKIAALETVDKAHVLTENFALQQEGDLTLWYAPHNEYINAQAKVLIVGITPGWSQTECAYQTAKAGIDANLDDASICHCCKIQSRFAGVMRKNLISMLDELGLQEKLGLSSCAGLFSGDNSLLHTTSLIKYPCFYKGKNYSGHSPAIASSPLLQRYIRNDFITELSCLQDVRLIIPLGSAVEAALQQIDLTSTRLLHGFPHPSGLNVRRGDQFRVNREGMEETLRNCLF